MLVSTLCSKKQEKARKLWVYLIPFGEMGVGVGVCVGRGGMHGKTIFKLDMDNNII